MERNIKNMKISNKYDQLVRKLIAGKSSPGEVEELALGCCGDKDEKTI